MKLSKREILLSCLLGFMLIIYLYNRFCLLPIEEEIGRLKDENRALLLSMEKDEEVIKTIKDTDRAYDLLEEGQEIEAALPYSPGAPDILSFLDSSARKNGVRMNAIRYSLPGNSEPGGRTAQNAKEGDDLQELELRISAGGSYRSLLGFISAIEESPRIIHIRQCRISGNRKPAIEEEIEETEAREEQPCRDEIEELPVIRPEAAVPNPMARETEELLLSLALFAYFEQNPSLLPPGENSKEVIVPQPQAMRNPFF